MADSTQRNKSNARDLQSNSTIQRRLQEEIQHLSKGQIHYEIKRGEQSSSPNVIMNEEAARVLLAFDRQESWSCHQTYRLFDDLHGPIFARPEVNGGRIIALVEVYQAAIDALPDLRFQLMAKYRLTRFFLLYLLRRILETDDQRKRFCRSPQDFLREGNGTARIRRCINAILGDLIVDVNAELQEREEQGKIFDYKRELKSPTAVRNFAQQIVPMYEKALKRGRVSSFSEEWTKSDTQDLQANQATAP